MKKILTVLVSLVLLCGCSPDPEKVEKGKNDGEVPVVRTYHYKGHTYLQLQGESFGYDNGIGWVHDPDCECLKEKGD